MNWFNEVFKNKQILFGIITLIFGIIPFALFILWGGFVRELKFVNFNIKDIGIFGGIYFLQQFLDRINGRRLGKAAERNSNEKIKDGEETITSTHFTLDEEVYVINYTSEYNEKKQKLRNRRLTIKKINKLRKEKRNLMYKGKEYAHIDKKIIHLEQEDNYLIDNKFVPYDYYDLLNNTIEDYENEHIDDGTILKDNVINKGMKKATFLTAIQSIGVGTLAFGFAWSLPKDITIAYMTTLVLSKILSTFINYVFSRFETAGSYLRGLLRKIEMHEDIINNYIPQKKLEEVQNGKEKQLQESEEIEMEEKKCLTQEEYNEIKALLSQTNKGGNEYTQEEWDKIANECCVTD